MVLDRQEALRIVGEGYDRMAGRYEDWLIQSVVDKRKPAEVASLRAYLTPGSRVLDLGCGGGEMTQLLAEEFDVTGVDISASQLARAVQRVPTGVFIQSDMMSVDL